MIRSFRFLSPALSSVLLALTTGSPALAQEAAPPAYRATFHPSELKGPPAGAPNEVLVLGTLHLSNLDEGFQPALLSPLLDRLAAWRPTAIATEDLSGLQCDSLRRYPSRYADTIKTYCWDPAPANQATGLDVPAANTEAERLLADWPAQPTAAQRRHLAAVFMAAGERGSALVQWLRLATEDRVADATLNTDLVAMLERMKTRRNETYLISAPLAARLGLERLWSVDDHSADTPDPVDPAEKKAYETAIMTAWDNPASHARRADSVRLGGLLSQPDGILDVYRAYNSAEAQQAAYRSDFGAALIEPSSQAFGRNYVGYWETRNLRMVANMRDVLGRYPGARMLTIVGASHKGYYEAYLDQMHDVRLVDVETVLR
ncbi:hypothetical protein GCM10017620_04230 [Brevundimonas intermedia]|uniref:TraB/GumN family protein n=1 Tax=Brevundimonas intermedia TaxID=74315 RepID=A0ABQ5T5S0_9CAUL|nr:DUF5694 domain-containing protein [Brevundimonas intermedia]GLK47450.1 hypothetical protein GCM10017620_04230 [Brevundimonas intermedia]